MDPILDLSKTAEQKLKRAGYSGSDVNLSIALHEYSPLVKEEAPGEYMTISFDPRWEDAIGIHKQYPVAYGFKRVYESDIEDGFDHSAAGILSFTGIATKEEWMQQSVVHRIQDVESYNGWLALQPVEYKQSIGELLGNLKD